MDQFEIWGLRKQPGQRAGPQLVVILQHKLLSDLETCVVAPLMPFEAQSAIGRLRPEISLGRLRLRVVVDRLSVVRRSDLTERKGSVEAQGDAIRKALDQLFFGV